MVATQSRWSSFLLLRLLWHRLIQKQGTDATEKQRCKVVQEVVFRGMTVNLITLEDVARMENILQRLELAIKDASEANTDYESILSKVQTVTTLLEQRAGEAGNKIGSLGKIIDRLIWQEERMTKLVETRYKEGQALWGNEKK